MMKLSVLLALIGAALLAISFIPIPAESSPVASSHSPTETGGATLTEPQPAFPGRALFRAKGCVACHRHDAVTGATSTFGPDLTNYVADPEFLRAWLQDPSAIRPDTLMPNLKLSPSEIEALIEFLVDNGGIPRDAVREEDDAGTRLTENQADEGPPYAVIAGASDPDAGTGVPGEGCPATTPADGIFRPPPPYPLVAPSEGQFWYGTERLWTMLSEDGRWDQLNYGVKMFWWRVGFDGRAEEQPALHVTARRLDGAAPIVEAGFPATNAYHPDIHWAMLAGIEVPTAGCWEIAGHYEDSTLAFVVWVAP